MQEAIDAEFFARSTPLIGAEGVQRLKLARVAVFGLGGVGSYTVEALARAGVGTLYLIDGDTISPSNLNRQLFALHSTLGLAKTAAAAQRIADINPRCTVHQHFQRVLPDEEGRLPFLDFLSSVDFMIDAVDTLALKVALAKEAAVRAVPLIAAMGCGNKLNPLRFQFADIYETSVCPLCKKMRNALKKAHIPHLRVLYSQEVPNVQLRPPASVSWVPSVAGMLIAAEVLQQLIHTTAVPKETMQAHLP